MEKLNNWIVVYISGLLFFMFLEKLKNKLEELNYYDGVIFFMCGVLSIDLMVCVVFDEF